MNVLFAMGTSTTADDTGYFLWLAQYWRVFLPPAIAICVALAFLVKHVIHRFRHGPNVPGQPEPEVQHLSQAPSSPPVSEPPPSWPLEFEAA